MLKTITLIFITFLIATSANAENADRHIHVNGEHLTESNIEIMDRLFGETVANGFYLINFQTGEWGYEGSQKVHGVLDTIADARNQQQAPTSGSNNSRTEVYNSQNGSAISGKLNGQDCTFVSAGEYTFKSCD